VAIALNMEAHKLRQTEAENSKQLSRGVKKDIQVHVPAASRLFSCRWSNWYAKYCYTILGGKKDTHAWLLCR